MFQGKCAHCGSMDVIAGLDQYQCLHCGNHTDHLGSAVAPPPVEPPITWFGRRNVDGGQFDSENGAS